MQEALQFHKRGADFFTRNYQAFRNSEIQFSLFVLQRVNGIAKGCFNGLKADGNNGDKNSQTTG